MAFRRAPRYPPEVVTFGLTFRHLAVLGGELYPAVMNRVDQIDRVMKELEACRRSAAPGDAGPVIGELDWLEELHYLLYGRAE